MTRTGVPRRPPKKEWSGPWLACPLCYRTMAMIVFEGREVYDCPECVEEYGEKQLDLFGGGS